jgi:hypothetical protein
MGVGKFASYTLLLVLLIGSSSASSRAAEPIRKEYDLLRTMPRQIIETMIPRQPDAIILGRGGCRYLIAAVVRGDQARADDAWKSIAATFAQQAEDGGLRGGGEPGDHPYTVHSIRVENMYFFLQELGHALLIVQASPMEPHFHDRIEALKPRLRKACDFIQQGYATIIPKVGATANRLLIAAKAFGLCGLVLDDQRLKDSSGRLVKAALARRDKDGVFIERHGRDSSYNAVSILMGTHLTLYIPNPELEAAFKQAMAWERTRIKPTGEIEVAGNTRTGVGKERSKSGVAKEVNYPEVSQTLWYYGALHNDPSAVALAIKVDEYRRSKR